MGYRLLPRRPGFIGTENELVLRSNFAETDRRAELSNPERAPPANER